MHSHGQPYVNNDRLERGLVLVLTGIEGRSMFNEEICKGLDAGGVPGAIELVDWTTIPIIGLRTENLNRHQADVITKRIVAYQDLHPRRPVVIVGQSGGGAMAIWTAEAMPAGRKVDGLILLAAAIGPDYMLDAALMNSRRGIVNFYSPRDSFLLGFGTFVVGTMDGSHSSSAGRVGFTVPPAALRPELYGKLYQIGWKKEMEASGYNGMHMTSGARGFVQRYLAPLVNAPAWSDSIVVDIENGTPPTFATPTPARPTRPAATVPPRVP